MLKSKNSSPEARFLDDNYSHKYKTENNFQKQPTEAKILDKNTNM